jgi:iron complex transport system substrate-binding protein
VRIVSLLPAATEMVVALGLGRRLVGVDHASTLPAGARCRVVTRSLVRRVGRDRAVHRRHVAAADGGDRFVTLDAAAVAALHPDLILTGDPADPDVPAESIVRAAARLAGDEVAVVSLAPTTLEGVFHAITTVGAMTGTEASAMQLVERLRGRLGRLERRVQAGRQAGRQPTRVVVIEAFDPPRATGRWVPEQVRRAGGWELLGREGDRSAPTTWAAVREVDPEVLVLAHRFRGREAALDEWARTRRPASWDRLRAVRHGQVFVVEGPAYFGRPGPRLVDGIALLAELLDPDTFVDVAPAVSWTPLL